MFLTTCTVKIFAQETTRQNAHTPSPLSEHQVAVICEGKHWNACHCKCFVVVMRWADAKGKL
jgi:hypothetical protein